MRKGTKKWSDKVLDWPKKIRFFCGLGGKVISANLPYLYADH